MNKYPCFDSVAINGLYLRSEFSNYDPMLIKNGDNILKETIEKIDIEKRKLPDGKRKKPGLKKHGMKQRRNLRENLLSNQVGLSIQACTLNSDIL